MIFIRDDADIRRNLEFSERINGALELTRCRGRSIEVPIGHIIPEPIGVSPFLLHIQRLPEWKNNPPVTPLPFLRLAKKHTLTIHTQIVPTAEYGRTSVGRCACVSRVNRIDKNVFVTIAKGLIWPVVGGVEDEWMAKMEAAFDVQDEGR